MAKLKIGDTAPDISGVDQHGETINLTSLRGRHAVVVFFYPKDGSPVCTKEVCSFRDSYERFADIGAVVIGVSADSRDSHRQFAERHRLPFHLISDSDGKFRKAFRVSRVLGILPGRETFVIDVDGIVRLAFTAHFASDEHVRRSIEALSK